VGKHLRHSTDIEKGNGRQKKRAYVSIPYGLFPTVTIAELI